MDMRVGRAVRRVNDGRRARSLVLVWNDRETAVRAVASAAMLSLLALLALATLSASGGAQSPRRDSSGWARASATLLARTAGDTIGPRTVQPADTIDATTIATRVAATADSMARTAPSTTYRSRADSIASVRTRLAADRDRDLRIVISLNDRMLWALIGPDTLLTAPVAVSKDETLEYQGKRWTFETPRGVRSVLAKREDPVWIPPDWHYAEVAREHGLKLASLSASEPTILSDGSRLEARNGEVGITRAGSDEFLLLRTDEEIIFDETLFIPPVGSVNRRIEGELGRHMLDTGNGFLLHGTPHKATIGTAATHGCIRLRDDDIQWLYDMMPVGSRVYIY